MSFRVAIVGFTQFENLGDQFIGKTVEYLVKQYGCIDTELMDFAIASDGGAITFLFRGIHKVTRTLEWKQLSNLVCIKKYENYYRKTLFKKLKKVDAIIFSGGSFKYGTQEVWAQYSAIIDYANRSNIPVMFDAMNVQKYDASDFRCEYLKKHLNLPCVKLFTSRDGSAGVQRLKNDYLEGGRLDILPAADPAYWIPEAYGLVKNKQSNIIGINAIAPNKFLIYGGTLKPEMVRSAYIELLRKLTERGYSWELFTNGLEEDNAFARNLAEYFKLSEEKVHIPKTDYELAQMEAGYMAVFGARLHSMICAYSLGVPVAGFVWDEKITHFAEMAKLEDLFLQERDVNGKAMFDVLMKAFNKKDDENNRNYWKETTKNTIFMFLDNLKNYGTRKTM